MQIHVAFDVKSAFCTKHALWDLEMYDSLTEDLEGLTGPVRRHCLKVLFRRAVSSDFVWSKE